MADLSRTSIKRILSHAGQARSLPTREGRRAHKDAVREVPEMQERKRPMPVGVEDFRDLVAGGYYFIDKTRFIRDLIDAPFFIHKLLCAS